MQGFVAYLEFLQDVDAPTEAETEAYIDNFVFGRDRVSQNNHTGNVEIVLILQSGAITVLELPEIVLPGTTLSVGHRCMYTPNVLA